MTDKTRKTSARKPRKPRKTKPDAVKAPPVQDEVQAGTGLIVSPVVATEVPKPDAKPVFVYNVSDGRGNVSQVMTTDPVRYRKRQEHDERFRNAFNVAASGKHKSIFAAFSAESLFPYCGEVWTTNGLVKKVKELTGN